MQPVPSLNRWQIMLAAAVIFCYSLAGCSKNSNPNLNKNDSDTVLRRTLYDSAKFYIAFDLEIAKTSGVFNDTFSDHASMIVYIVNGVVKVPHDSLRNFPPIVFPTSGTSGKWSATYVPDNIGEINITAANGIVIPGDTTVVMALTQTGTVIPEWKVSFDGGAPSTAGGDASPGWPLTFSFNPQLSSQYPFKLEQQGSAWSIWCYKDY
jgi:hypothetical protein